MRSFMWSLSSFKRRLGSKKSSKRRKIKFVILSDDTTSKRHVKHTRKSTTDHEEAKRQLGYDSDTLLVNLKRLVVKDCQHDDLGPSRGQPSDDEEGGQTSVEASDHSDVDLSGAGKSDDDESSVKAHKDKAEKPSFFCNRRLRQAAKNKDNNIACGAVQTRAKKDNFDPDSLELTLPSVTLAIDAELLYVDSFKCKGIDIDSSVVPISFWTFQRLRDRERIEIKGGGFGKGTVKPLTSYEGVKVGLDEPSI
ncbi:LOW QUALITY PROTEIN: hypothetical protein M8C21_016698, partial [Ambrosia artemisiifolia]